MSNAAERLLAADSVFYVLRKLETPNLALFAMPSSGFILWFKKCDHRGDLWHLSATL